MFDLVIAGPGAGKTTSLVKKVKEILGDLSENPYQFGAVITYTNAAAEEIRQRLQRDMTIPSNVFIGTTHQFLIRFIVQPYGHLANLPQEKLYIDAVKMTTQMNNVFKQMATEKKIAESLSQRGIIIYDKILEIADRLVSQPKVCKLISERIKYLFIDEYQDAQLLQHQVFEKIYEQGNTNLYCIGDPLQSIYGFSYANSQLLTKPPKPESFGDAPIQRFKSHANCNLNYIRDNHRSSCDIVALINLYTFKVDLAQTSVNGDVNVDAPIIFINCNTLSDIADNFNRLVEEYEATVEDGKLHKLFLAKDWKHFDGLSDSHEVSELDYGSHTINNQFQEMKQCVLGALGLLRKDIIEFSSKQTHFEKRLSWRLFCLQTLSEIKANQIDDVKTYIQQEFEKKYQKPIPHAHNADEKNTSIKSTAEKLCRSAKQKTSDSFYSSVHSAKGLEATCVLVYTNTANQLEKWLDFENVDNDDDGFRLGYVAFSRARKILCIACRETPKASTIEKMERLNFHFK